MITVYTLIIDIPFTPVNLSRMLQLCRSVRISLKFISIFPFVS